MKKFEKFLRASKKLEEHQTVRKAKEVGEIEKFDNQKEHYKCHKIDRMFKIDRAHTEGLKQELEKSVTVEEEWLQDKTEELSEIEAFDRQAQDMQNNAPGNEFEIVAELQGFTFGQAPHEMKQLPAGSPDTLNHDLNELTESHLQRELERNKAAINKEQESEEEKEDTDTVFFFRPPASGPK